MHVDDGRNAVDEMKFPADKQVSQSQIFATFPPKTT